MVTDKHCEKYDAYFDEETGDWTEDKCESKDCEYCSKRPEKHIPHKWEFINGKEDWCGKDKQGEPR